MKRVVTIRVENRVENQLNNGAPVEGCAFASREYHVPLTVDMSRPDELINRLDRVLIDEGWLK